MEIVQKASVLFDDCSEFTLASVSEEGYPRICVLSKTKNEGIHKAYAATGISSVKVRHFQKNPKASICFYGDGNSITLMGNVSVTQDRAVLESMWLDWFTEHFPGGIDDPEYCVMEFITKEATLWVDGEFVTVTL